MLDKKFHGIKINFEDHWANVTSDKKLMDVLSTPGNGSVALATYILDRYYAVNHKLLEIPKMSLAVEILVHAYLDVLSQNTEKIQSVLPQEASKPIIQLIEEVHEKAAVINCGEASVDHNRLMFNDLAPFHSLICTALENLA